jgi:hypothetical protein
VGFLIIHLKYIFLCVIWEYSYGERGEVNMATVRRFVGRTVADCCMGGASVVWWFFFLASSSWVGRRILFAFAQMHFVSV